MSLEKIEKLNALQKELKEKKELYEQNIKRDRDNLKQSLLNEFRDYYKDKGYSSEVENIVAKDNLEIIFDLGKDLNNSNTGLEGKITIKTIDSTFAYLLDVFMPIKANNSSESIKKQPPADEPDRSIFIIERDLKYYTQIANKEYTTSCKLTLSKVEVPKMGQSSNDKSKKAEGEDLKDLLSKMEL